MPRRRSRTARRRSLLFVGEESQDEESDQEDDEGDGQADLDEAFDLKINAKSTRDLDRVADLCEVAIEKGLDESAEKQARQLWASVLYDHAKQLQRRIAPGGTLSTRWRWLRREAMQPAVPLAGVRQDRAETDYTFSSPPSPRTAA